MIQAVSEFAARAAEKLRAQGGTAPQMLVFAQTSPFRPGKSYSRSITLSLRRPTSNTLDLVATAARGMRAIYRPGVQFMKAGVMLLDLVPPGHEQAELALDSDKASADRLMGALDAINDHFGQGTMRVASAGVGQSGCSALRRCSVAKSIDAGTAISCRLLIGHGFVLA